MKTVSLVIPAYNEEDVIEETVSIFSDDLQRLTDQHEIIIVNDGSSDRTAEIAERLSRVNPNIKVIHNPKNLGSGKSLLAGFKECRYDFVVTDFADRPFDVKELENILSIFDDRPIDFVVVVRKNRSANPAYRKITSFVNYLLIRLLFNAKIGDFQFVQIYKRKIIEDVDVRSTRTFVPPELIMRLLDRGYKVYEYETDFLPRTRGRPKCGSPRIIMKTLFEMFRFWWQWMVLRKDRRNIL